MTHLLIVRTKEDKEFGVKSNEEHPVLRLVGTVPFLIVSHKVIEVTSNIDTVRKSKLAVPFNEEEWLILDTTQGHYIPLCEVVEMKLFAFDNHKK